jgi:hypothetical protein
VCHIIWANVSNSLYEVAHQLLVWEIPFKTLERIPRNCTLPPIPSMPMFHNRVTLGMGVYPRDYIFTLNDYNAYETKHDAIIQTHQGWAALLKGGIIWRLA